MKKCHKNLKCKIISTAEKKRLTIGSQELSIIPNYFGFPGLFNAEIEIKERKKKSRNNLFGV